MHIGTQHRRHRNRWQEYFRRCIVTVGTVSDHRLFPDGDIAHTPHAGIAPINESRSVDACLGVTALAAWQTTPASART